MVHLLTSTGKQFGNSSFYIDPLESPLQYFLYHFFINQTCHIHVRGWLCMNLITWISMTNCFLDYIKKTVNQLNDYIELSFCFPRTFLNSSRICFDLFFSLEKKHNIFYHSCPISNFLHKRTPWIQLLVS